jgi:hypothetical protein
LTGFAGKAARVRLEASHQQDAGAVSSASIEVVATGVERAINISGVVSNVGLMNLRSTA